MNDNRNVILLNNLFNGEYIKDKVGGEIINMYQSDNNNYYVYVNPYGNIEKKWDNKIKYVLFIRSVGNGFVKVIGKAEIVDQICLNSVFNKDYNTIDKDQKDYIEQNDIKYGGTKIHNLGSWSKYFVTFKANGIFKPKADIYLSANNIVTNTYTRIYHLKNIDRINNQSQKLYIDESTQPENYNTIKNFINDPTLWEENPVGKVILNENNNEVKRLLSIIKKEKDELVNSNLLAYFLENDSEFWSDFSKKVLGFSDENVIKGTPKITRESIGNIDLFIEVANSIIVIENKIKSGINGKNENGDSQLDKYVKEAEEHRRKNPNMTDSIKYYILRPNYNNENYKNEKFKEIKYSEIYEIIKDRDSNFHLDEFKSVVKKHSAEYDNELYEIMNERFIEQIKANKL